MVKGLEFCLIYNKQVLFKCFFFRFVPILSSPVRFAVHREKSFVLTFFKVNTDYLFDNLESGKSLEFLVPKSVRTLCLKMFKTRMPVEQPAKILKDTLDKSSLSSICACPLL